MSSTNHYLRSINKALKYRATWSPGSPMKLGDVGTIQDGVFVQESSLENVGITNATVESGESFNQFNYTSESGVSISTKAKGSAVLPGSQLTVEDAGFSIDLSNEKSVIFRTSKPTESKITNIANIRENIQELYQKGKWQRDWLVISSVIEVEAATIIVSGGKKGHLDISAKGKAEVANSDIVNLDAGLEIKWSRDVAINIVAQQGATPLYRVHGFRKAWFLGRERFITRDADGISDEDKSKLTEGEVFEEVDHED